MSTSSTTSSMQALVLHAFDTPLSLDTVARPVPAAGQVLVRIIASGVNPLDIKIRQGKAAHAQFALSGILGIDLAGYVEALGAGVSKFNIGDAVYGMTGGIGNTPGSLAEYAAVDADLLALKPTSMSMREAAALPLVFITAWEGLVDRARTQSGQNVLVHGGAGGVGHIAVQIARALGAEVFATGSPTQKQTIDNFGATAIDYTSTSVEEYVAIHTGGEGFDVIYDTVGGATLDASFSAARHYHGHVVSCLGWGAHKLAPLSFRAATYSGVFTLLPLLTGKGRAHHGDILREATRLVDAGKLTILLDSRHFTLSTISDAHDAVENGTALGKIVIDIGNE